MLRKIFLLIFLFSNFGHFANGLSLQELIEEAKHGPIELAASPTPTAASIGITLPPSMSPDGEHGLYNSAKDLSTKADALLTLIEELLGHYNSDTGDEISDLKMMVANLTEMKSGLNTLLEDVSTVQSYVAHNEIRIQNLTAVLGCLQQSNCVPYLLTTTTATPPEAYNCNTDNLYQTLYNAGDFGNWTVSIPAEFDGTCEFTIKSNKSVGLWITVDLTIDSENGSATVEVFDNRGVSKNFTESGTITLHGQKVLIAPNGTLAFSADFVATDPCASYSCGHGTCSYDLITNEPKCTCQSCYTVDSSGSCTVRKSDTCSPTYQSYCAPGGGICHINATTCDYYCYCPMNNCAEATFCDPSINTCGLGFADLRKNWFF